MVINDKALVGIPMPTVKDTRSRSIRRSCGPFGGLSKGASQGDLRGEIAKGEGGAGEEVGPEGEDEKGGERAQRRDCEQREGRVLEASPVHKTVDDEVGQVRLGEKEGGF